MINRIVSTLQNLLRLNRATESLLIDIIASYSPWLAPIVPALMTYQNMVTHLGFPHWAGLAGAAVVETLGLSSVQTTITFWSWNSMRSKSAPRAPLALAVFTGLFYLATVLTVNAMLDNTAPIYRIAKALLSSLSLCAGVILALRAGHAQRLADMDQQRQQRREERAAVRLAKVARSTPVVPPPFPSNGNGHKPLVRRQPESIQ
jgi:hypothetical protein